jgi:hypothetical protein
VNGFIYRLSVKQRVIESLSIIDAIFSQMHDALNENRTSALVFAIPSDMTQQSGSEHTLNSDTCDLVNILRCSLRTSFNHFFLPV